ncbi:MAG: hypothetical protein OXT06_00525 [Rhodospirillaceae bacterium]|nr:hypothetical protein [Rhodospirillaceae bacterium]MDD9918099.1 hypothetical protein [Rhodospirillaceae bacterium]
MQIKTQFIAVSFAVLLTATPSLGGPNNYNPNAGGNGNGNGASNANCNAAFFSSCDNPPIEPVSAAPSPEIGSALSLILLSGLAIGWVRRRKI